MTCFSHSHGRMSRLKLNTTVKKLPQYPPQKILNSYKNKLMHADKAAHNT